MGENIWKTARWKHSSDLVRRVKRVIRSLSLLFRGRENNGRFNFASIEQIDVDTKLLALGRDISSQKESKRSRRVTVCHFLTTIAES